MSYVSGFMMGAALGRQLHDVLFAKGGAGSQAIAREPAAIETFRLASALPGRRRYYAQALLGNARLAVCLEEKLRAIPFIKDVSTNAQTGSLLIRYEGAESRMDAVAAFLAQRVFAVPSAQQPAAAWPLADDDAEPAISSQSIRRTVRALNAKIRECTMGWFDLSSILSIAFIIRGLRKMLSYSQRPTGPQMLWWALSLLKGGRVA